MDLKGHYFSNNKLPLAPPMQINARALCLTSGHSTANRHLSLWWTMSSSSLRKKQHPFSSCWSPLWPTLVIAWLVSAPVLPLICFRGRCEHEATSTLNPLALKCSPISVLQIIGFDNWGLHLKKTCVFSYALSWEWAEKPTRHCNLKHYYYTALNPSQIFTSWHLPCPT